MLEGENADLTDLAFGERRGARAFRLEAVSLEPVSDWRRGHCAPQWGAFFKLTPTGKTTAKKIGIDRYNIQSKKAP